MQFGSQFLKLSGFFLEHFNVIIFRIFLLRRFEQLKMCPLPGYRPFICPFEGCTQSFTTSNIRKVHMRTHTGERPYICGESGCGKMFASATNYKNHIRIHSGTGSYINISSNIVLLIFDLCTKCWFVYWNILIRIIITRPTTPHHRSCRIVSNPTLFDAIIDIIILYLDLQSQIGV